MKRALVPEQQPSARVAIFAASAIACLALAVCCNLWAQATVTIAIVYLGHQSSWRGRNAPRTLAGQALFLLLLSAALAYLFLDLFGGAFGGNLPQAQFALAALAITSFDLKTRRNLFSHLWHSLAIIYVAALFAFSTLFLVFIGAWAVAMWVFFTSTSTSVQSRVSWKPLLASSGWALRWLAIGLVIFIAMPRLPGRPWAIPLLINVPVSASANSIGLPAVLPLVGTTSSNFTSGSINLRVPPELGNEVVMHVRAAAPSYWRAYSLDYYTGQAWEASAEESHPISGVTVGINYENQPVMNGPTLAQTFEIERPLGTQIIGSYPIQEVYFPAQRLIAQEDGALQAPFALHQGLIYGVVSPVRDLSAQHLRAVEPDSAFAAPEEFQLPATIPERDWQLADQIVAGQTNEYDRVEALVQYLSHTYQYSLRAPTQSGDAVDNLLFVDHYGFCEQFATALAAMLRMEGIPSRVAIGYATGERDAFTGTFTVRNSDAHAWVEVLFPDVGWVPFDATPSFPSSPIAQVADSFGSFSLLTVAGAVPGGGDTILVVVILLALLLVMYSITRRHLERRHFSPALRSYIGANDWLALAGLPARNPFQTPREHLAAVKRRSPSAGLALQSVIDAVEVAAFEERPAAATSTLRVALAAALHWLGIRP